MYMSVCGCAQNLKFMHANLEPHDLQVNRRFLHNL